MVTDYRFTKIRTNLEWLLRRDRLRVLNSPSVLRRSSTIWHARQRSLEGYSLLQRDSQAARSGIVDIRGIETGLATDWQSIGGVTVQLFTAGEIVADGPFTLNVATASSLHGIVRSDAFTQ